MLRNAQIYEVIVLFKGLDITCLDYDIRMLISQWCSKTHTFIAAWCEFTPTLEAATPLFALNVNREIDFSSYRLPIED